MAKFQPGDVIRTVNRNFLYRVKKVNRGWLYIYAAYDLMEGKPQHYVGTEVYKIRTGDATKYEGKL